MNTTLLRVLICAACGAAVGVARYVFNIDLDFNTALAVGVPALAFGSQALKRVGDESPKDKPGQTNKAPFFMLLCVALASQGCLHGGPVNWPKYAKCGVGAVSDVVATVSRILLAGSGQSVDSLARNELNQLAAEHGASTIACLIATLVSDWTAPPLIGGSTNIYTVDAALRGRNFLQSVGTTPYWE